MVETMSPSEVASTITAGQIGKAQELVGAALRKSNLPSDPTQKVLEAHGGELADEYVASLRKRVEAISNMIARRVKVDRTRDPQKALDATGRKQYTDKGVVKAMPKGHGEEPEVLFFKVGRTLSDNDLEKEYALRGLKPADPYSLAQVNADDPAFADDRPNGTHWQDANGNWCFAAFHRWDGVRKLSVGRDGGVWVDGWWFAGLRK